jgi:hypothetical protein
MPPTDFVRWARLRHLEPGAGSTLVFTHVTSYLKTVDKQALFEGSGVIGSGTLVQGLLADRWLLNAIAMCVTRPYLLTSLFSTTGQETDGRYCVRIYEGFSWKTIFIDDRIPCSLAAYPLFSRSSDTEESFIMILEKAMAKYLGSYGHVAVAGALPDAHLCGLRLLTGGHVYKFHVQAQCTWESVRDHSEEEHHEDDGQSHIPKVPKIDGAQLVKSLFKEGSLVAFGISELCSIYADYLRPRTIESGQPWGPFGYQFPVVGVEVIEGFIWYHVRDAWGLILSSKNDDPNTNLHNPAALPVPGDASLYGGSSSSQVNYPLDNEYLSADHGTGHCRTFKIKAEDVPKRFDTVTVCRYPDSIRDRAQILRIPAWKTSVAGRPSLGREHPAHFRIKVIGKIKEPDNKKNLFSSKSRDLPKAATTKSGKATSKKSPLRKKEEDNQAEQEIDNQSPVDVAFTFCSGCNWIVSGASEAGAEIRVRIVRSFGSAHANPAAKSGKKSKKKSQKGKFEHVDQVVVRMVEGQHHPSDEGGRLQPTEHVDPIVAQSSSKTVGTHSGSHSNANAHNSDSSDNEGGNTSGYDSDNKMFQSGSGSAPSAHSGPQATAPLVLEYSAALSWISFSVDLLPGDYHVFADISFDLTDEEMLRRAHVEKSEEPEGPAMNKKAAAAIAAHQAQYEQALKQDSDEQRPVHENPVNRVLMQTSTTGLIDVRAVMTEHVQQPHKRADLSTIRVRSDRWPFHLEQQADVASAGLVNMLSQYKHDAEMQAIKVRNIHLLFRDKDYLVVWQLITHLKKYRQLDREINFHLEEEEALRMLSLQSAAAEEMQ